MSSTSSVGGGTFVQSGTVTYLSGGSSGIDTSALIEAAVAQRLREADKIDVKIDTNTAKLSAYDQLQQLGTAIQTSLSGLRQAYGVTSTEGGVFKQKSGTIASSNAVDPSTLLSVVVDDGAENSTSSITVHQKAKVARISSGSVADSTAALGYTGDFTLNLAGKAAQTISVAAGDNLNDIASKINASSTLSGVSAQVVKVSDTSYELVLSGSETGLALQTSFVSGDDVLQNLGVTDGGGAYLNVLQPEQSAIVEYNGVMITRTSNTISDLIDGVTFTIKNADPGTELTLNIGADNAALKSAILDFVDAYNNLRDFVITNSTVATDGSVSDDSVLYRDGLMLGMNDQLQALFAKNFATGGAETLRELGITLDKTNKLVVDEGTLDTQILDNYDVVQAMFQTQYSDDNAEFNITRNTSDIQNLSFALNITTDGTNITGVDVGGDTSYFTFSGATITGVAGTPYEGLTFAYVGTASTTVNISLDQGLADLTNSMLDGYVTPIGGLIQTQKLELESVNDQLSQRASRVRERADSYRDSLIERYASFEARLAAAKSTLAQIRAILGTDNEDN